MSEAHENIKEYCIFCKIIAGEIPSHTVYEDENTLAFLDAKPVNPGHTLVVPKKHFENIHDTPEEVLCTMIATTQKVAGAVKKAVSAKGININVNNGRAAGQAVFHVHFHVIPRFEGDGYELWHGRKYKEGEAEEVARQIRTQF